MTALRRTVAPLVALVLGLGTAGCVPEPAAFPTASATANPGTTVTASTRPSADSTSAPTPTPTSSPRDGIALPSDCAALYSSGMTATLNQQLPPLNDPGVTLFSSQNSAALEALNSGIPTLRCSWGIAGEAGLATNVSIIDTQTVGALRDAFASAGYGCEDSGGGVVCSIQKQTIDLDDNLVTTGEQHYLRGNGWISTAYVDAIPEGYTQDIAGTLWG